MGSFLVLLVVAACFYYFFSALNKAARIRQAPAQTHARVTAAANAAHAARAASVRRTESALQVATSSPAKATDRYILLAAFLATLILAGFVGGLTPALIMGAAIVLCVAPGLVFKLKARRQFRTLLRDSRVADDAPLFIPEDWHKQH